MTRGTNCGNIAEIELVKQFNKTKNSNKFKDYLLELNIKNTQNIFLIRVTTKQFSKLSNQKVMTRADAYMIESNDDKIKKVIEANKFYLDETLLAENHIDFNAIKYSGISIKISDSDKFQIIKLTPDSFFQIFNEYEIGAGASIYCLNESEFYKNESVCTGWKTTFDQIVKKYCAQIPKLIDFYKLNKNEQGEILKEIKEYSNERIRELINNSKYIQEIIFNGYHIYEEPYSASFFYKNENVKKLSYIPFTVTTGSGRSKGNYTIVLKPKKVAN